MILKFLSRICREYLLRIPNTKDNYISGVEKFQEGINERARDFDLIGLSCMDDSYYLEMGDTYLEKELEGYRKNAMTLMGQGKYYLMENKISSKTFNESLSRIIRNLMKIEKVIKKNKSTYREYLKLDEEITSNLSKLLNVPHEESDFDSIKELTDKVESLFSQYT